MIIKNLKRITDLIIIKIKNLIVHPLFSGSFIMMAGSMVVNVVSYIYHLLMGRIMGPIDYGVLASISSVLYITTIIPSSASISIVKFIASAKSITERSKIYWSINKFVFRLALALGICFALLAPFISEFLNISDSFIVVLIAPILFFGVITLVNMSTMQGVLKFFGVIGPSLTSALGKLIFGLAFVYWGYSVLGAVWGVVIGTILAYILSFFMIKGTVFGIRESGEYKLGKFLKYSLPVLLQSLAFTSFFTSDVILVKHFLTSYDAGIYAALSNLGKIVFFASAPIAATMFPIITQRYSKGENYSNVLLASIVATAAISLGVCLIYFIFPKFAVVTLYGDKYLSASQNLFLMGLFIAFYSISYLLTNFYLSIGNIGMVYYPLVIAAFQIIGITIWHDNIGVVIKISLFLMIVLTLALSSFLRYNLSLTKNEKEKDFAFRSGSRI